MNDIKAVVFDMDGVLLDTESMSDISWIKAAEEFSIHDIKNQLNVCRGANYSDTVEILQRAYGSSQDFDAEKFLSRTRELFTELEETEGIKTMKGAREILAYLKEKDYRLALASSTRGEAVRRQLKNAGLLDFFEAVVTGDTVTHSKPDPEIYLKACECLKTNPKNCAAIEDSLNGVKSACNAGLKCIMVPDMVQPTDEIKKIVWKICASLSEAQKLF